MAGSLLHIEGAKPNLTPDILFTVWGVPISNVVMMTWFIMILFVIIILVANSVRRLVPGRFQSLIELVVEGIEGLILQVSGSPTVARRLRTVVGPLFIFLVVSNLIGLLPGLAALSYGGSSLFRTATSDYNLVLPLGLLISILIQIETIKSMGVLSYVGKFIQVRQVWEGMKRGAMGTFEGFIAVFIGFMDVIGEVAKVMSMTLRLFGNIYAGEVMTVVFYGLFSFLAPAAWHGLSSFSGLIQALVFTLLTIVFYTMAVAGEEPSQS